MLFNTFRKDFRSESSLPVDPGESTDPQSMLSRLSSERGTTDRALRTSLKPLFPLRNLSKGLLKDLKVQEIE